MGNGGDDGVLLHFNYQSMVGGKMITRAKIETTFENARKVFIDCKVSENDMIILETLRLECLRMIDENKIGPEMVKLIEVLNKRIARFHSKSYNFGNIIFCIKNLKIDLYLVPHLNR